MTFGCIEDRAFDDDWLEHDRHLPTTDWLAPRSPAPEPDPVISIRIVGVGGVFESPPFEPRTALGQKLWALRKKAVEDGLRLMTADEIEEELKERRGHRSE